MALVLAVRIRIDALKVVLARISLHLNLVFDRLGFDLLFILSLHLFITRHVDRDASAGYAAIIFLVFRLLLALVVQALVAVGACLFAQLSLHQSQLVLLFALIGF